MKTGALHRNMATDNLQKETSRLNLLVNVMAGVILVMIVAFFIVVVQNARAINENVDNVQKGPYPVSVAAGHIETDLIRLQTVIEHMTATQLGADPGFETASENSFTAINKDMKEQLEVIGDSTQVNPENLSKFRREYQLLSSRMSEFSKMCWGTMAKDYSYEEIVAYADIYLYPILNYLLDLNTGAIDQTNTAIEELHQGVNESVGTMTLFALVMLIVMVLTIIIYQVLLTRRTKLESELRESLEAALKVADEANAAKSSFLSNMSHDIRTPMNAIVGLTTIADENIDDKLRVKQCLNRIATSSQHLLSLINDVLDMNKIESGKVTLTQEEFSITELVDGIEVIMQSQPGSKRLKKTVEVRNLRHDLLVGDALRLRQILLNLTSNALKYSNEGDSVSLVVTEEGFGERGCAEFSFVVSDTGIGMKQDFLAHIFEPFEREKNDFTIFTEGTGLGMAITKNLVDLMGGTIKIDSELGIGTTVTIGISFKIASPESMRRYNRRKRSLEATSAGAAAQDAEESDGLDAEDLPEPAPAKKAVTNRLQVKGSVLVVEDNEINMEIAKQLIESRGATVDEAIDGFDAMTKVTEAEDDKYDLVLMDMQMPHMNGVESTKAIRSYEVEHNRRHVPIVAMTANAFESDREKALGAGMDDFVTKPIDVHRLEDVLQTYLEEV